jgi:hypothetical protein
VARPVPRSVPAPHREEDEERPARSSTKRRTARGQGSPNGEQSESIYLPERTTVSRNARMRDWVCRGCAQEPGGEYMDAAERARRDCSQGAGAASARSTRKTRQPSGHWATCAASALRCTRGPSCLVGPSHPGLALLETVSTIDGQVSRPPN